MRQLILCACLITTAACAKKGQIAGGAQPAPPQSTADQPTVIQVCGLTFMLIDGEAVLVDRTNGTLTPEPDGTYNVGNWLTGGACVYRITNGVPVYVGSG